MTEAQKPAEGRRRLFRKGESLSTQAQLGMFGYDDYLIASGFQSAAQILATFLKEGGPHPHLLVYPLVFDYRQFVELMLKHIVRGMQSFATFANDSKVDAALSAHAIEPLIELIAAGMEAVDPQLAYAEEMGILKGRIGEFQEMDPGPYAFRYTRDKRGKRYNEPNTTFDLAAFAAEMEEVAVLLYDLSEWSVGDRRGARKRRAVLPQLQPVARGALREAFCDKAGIDLSVLEQGRVVLVEIDETEHPRAVGTVIRMIFRRIVQMARERTAAERVGFLDQILLICDEYTNYAAPGHVQAWNTVRESNFCATVGITSISGLTKQLGGDQNATNAIVANFANKFFFEVDDKATRDLARELIGQTTVLRRGTTQGTSKTHGSSSNANLSGGSHQSRGSSHSQSMSEHREEGIDGEIWRGLHAERDFATAIAFVRTGSGIATDVVTLGVLDPAEQIVTALPEAYGVLTLATDRQRHHEQS